MIAIQTPLIPSASELGIDSVQKSATNVHRVHFHLWRGGVKSGSGPKHSNSYNLWYLQYQRPQTPTQLFLQVPLFSFGAFAVIALVAAFSS